MVNNSLNNINKNNSETNINIIKNEINKYNKK